VNLKEIRLNEKRKKENDWKRERVKKGKRNKQPQGERRV
jgi:hypothetical protein